MFALPGISLTRQFPLSGMRGFTGILLLLSTAGASAAQISSLRGGGPLGGSLPTVEALESCSGEILQNTCTMMTPRGEMSGTCTLPAGSDVLACMPEGMERGRRNSNLSQGEPSRGSNRPPFRKHSITKSSGLDFLYPASEMALGESQFTSRIEGEWRVLTSNSISEHNTGVFPNGGNPNSVSEFSIEMRVPTVPQKTNKATRVKMFGIAFNGVSFDPGAGEFYQGDPSLGWQYEPLSGAVKLGLDESHAHVQPTGKYHYHGLPTGLLKRFGVSPSTHSPQIGWAADGFPIYALYGLAELDGDDSVNEMQSSYQLKPGSRITGSGQPGGAYDGTFTSDYEYVEGLGDLDECNGRVTVTPDFPYGTYAYYLTDSFPVVPRCVMGTPERKSRRKPR